jgi:Asp-tRNA(Asn)/Glu-tRNA(Gln) amidotransferase A subunit family amidase
MGRELSKSDIIEYAEKARLDPSGIDPEAQIEGIRDQDDLVSKLDDLDSSSPREREHWTPEDEGDPYAAFLARCDLQRTDDGVLAGRTVAVKDNIAVAGIPMTCGSPFLEDHVPAEDATVVERILDAGGRVVGKANMDEFALGGDPDAMRFRLARNPNDPDHQPGGSSAGSGVAVADDQADVALGTDTGGSVRFPASFCGVVGLKPSRGLVPLTGFVQFSKTNDTIGVLADTVEDTARTLTAIAGPDTEDTATQNSSPEEYVDAVRQASPSAADEITIGIPTELFELNAEIEEVVQAALDDLETAGATVREVSIPDFEYAIPAWWAIAMTEAAAYFNANATTYWQCSQSSPALTDAMREAFEAHPETIGKYTTGVILYGQHMIHHHGSHYYAKAQRARELVTAGIDSALEEVDVLASPTVPMTAPKWEDEGYLEDGTLDEALRTTGPFNLTGHPAISIPCGEIEGLPVGLQFIGSRGNDAMALHAASVWESLRNS